MTKWTIYGMTSFMDREKLPFIINHVQRSHKRLKNEDNWKQESVQCIIQHHRNTVCRKRGESLESGLIAISLRRIEMWCRSWLVFVVTKDLEEMLHLLYTAHSFVCEFISDTQIGQHKCKVNNLSLRMVMEYLQFSKEQIQLAISLDTEVSRKSTGTALLCQVGIRFKAWVGKGKANMSASPFSLAQHSRYAIARAGALLLHWFPFALLQSHWNVL